MGVSAVRVPSRATRFTDQTLTCSYNLGDMGLYAVKWYLNDSEFFRWVEDLTFSCNEEPSYICHFVVMKFVHS